MTKMRLAVLAALAIAAATVAAKDASAGSALKSPSECELHLQISNAVPAECTPGQEAVKYRAIVPTKRVAVDSPVLQAQPVSTAPRSANLIINFELDSARLTPDARQDLDRLVNVLNHGVNGSSRFMVVGHTDASGDENYNVRLSGARAEAVAAYLADRGVARPRITTLGVGKKELLDAANPESPANRRVEIRNLGQ